MELKRPSQDFGPSDLICQALNAYSYAVATDLHRLPEHQISELYRWRRRWVNCEECGRQWDWVALLLLLPFWLSFRAERVNLHPPAFLLAPEHVPAMST